MRVGTAREVNSLAHSPKNRRERGESRMDEAVRRLRIVAFLLAVLVVQVGWVGVQLLIRPASAQSGSPVPVGACFWSCPSGRTAIAMWQ